jgi:Arc/MetJ-type ribon-helix-helix transcriptional regulator
MYNHLMSSRVINVRLGPEDERVARQLRARGISISEVVRRALHAEARKAAELPTDTDSVLNEIMERYPTPSSGRRPRRPNTVDRHAVRKHIEQRLRGKR